MNSLIRIGILWCLAISIGSAQEADTSKDEANQHNPGEQQASASSKAIVLVIDADAQKSKVVKEVIAALEKAGIATGKAAETAPPKNSPISVTLNIRKDESYDKIKQLIEALKNAGVLQMSVREGGVQYQGKEINQLHVDLQPGYSPAEYEKIDLAAIAVMDHCGLSLLRARNWLSGEAEVRHPLDDVNLPVSDSSERTNPAMDSGFITKLSQTADLRTQYEAANKQAHDLAESLRQTPDAAKKAELRTAVQRAYTLRQSLLRAELQEMQTRLEKTQKSLDMRDRMADQIVDRRVEGLLNPELEWGLKSNDETKIQSEVKAPVAPGSPGDDSSGVVTELEGDWHRVAYIDKWQTERRPINMTIRANQETATLWTGESYSRTVVIDQNAKTIEVGAHELKSGLPNQVVSERGTYTLSEDLLTIHSEYTISDSVRGAIIQKGQHTNIWKRGLCKIEDYDGRNPGPGMGFFNLNGSDENTGWGKLLPGHKVDVLASLASKDGTPTQRVLVESIEVDGSSEPNADRRAERQIRLIGTREQCLIIDDAKMRGVTLSVSRKLDGKTQQFPGGINTDTVKEMKEVAPQKSLDVSRPTPFP